MYDVNYFIKKFEAIPEEMWTTGEFDRGDGCKCALGHCGVNHFQGTDEGKALHYLLNYYADEINDGASERYQQDTPKQRILAALNDVKHDRF